ncbi:hypothetical protein FOZ63_015783, partial [Perkinsus olseni]
MSQPPSSSKGGEIPAVSSERPGQAGNTTVKRLCGGWDKESDKLISSGNSSWLEAPLDKSQTCNKSMSEFAVCSGGSISLFHSSVGKKVLDPDEGADFVALCKLPEGSGSGTAADSGDEVTDEFYYADSLTKMLRDCEVVTATAGDEAGSSVGQEYLSVGSGED